MLVAAVAMAFSACQKQEAFEPETTTDEVVLTFSSEKPSFADETKTEWTGETIYWSDGDKIRVAYTADGVWQNADGNSTAEEANGSKTAKIYASTGASAGKTATFSVPTGNNSFKTIATGELEFYGVYPYTASDASMPYAPSVTVTIPAEQKPLENSFDSKADLMAAKSASTYIVSDENPLPETIPLAWTRLVAHGYFTIKNLAVVGEEDIKSITLTANAEADMVGQHYLYLDTYNVVKPNGNSAPNKLTIDATNLAITDGSVSFWACFLPCTWTSVTVQVETDKATYTREIDLAGNQKTFAKNARNNLTVNMSEAVRNEKEVDASDYSGVYAILTKRSSGGYWYMTNDLGSASTKRLTAEEAGDVLPEEGVTLDASKLWEVSKLGDYYTVKSVETDQYIIWTSGNSANLGDNNPVQFTITLDGGLYNLMYKASDANRFLSLNNTSGNNYFALYKVGQAADLALIPAVEGEDAPATLSSIAVSGEKTTYNVNDEFVKPTVTATYSDGSTKDVTEFATFEGYSMSVAGTYTVTVSYMDKTTTYSITISGSQGGETSKTWKLVTDASTLTAGDKLAIVSSSKGKVAGSLTSQYLTSIAVTITGNAFSTLPSGAVEFTLGGASGAWTLAGSDGKLLGATAVKKLAWGSGTTTWSISIDGSGNATIQNGTSSYGRFLYNNSSPRFTTYTSNASSSMLLPQIYRYE